MTLSLALTKQVATFEKQIAELRASVGVLKLYALQARHDAPIEGLYQLKEIHKTFFLGLA
jgi:hypothetical protein